MTGVTDAPGGEPSAQGVGTDTTDPKHRRALPTYPAESWFGATVLFLAIGVVVPLVVIGQELGGLGHVSTVMALLLTGYAAVRLAGHYLTGRPHLIQITFWSFVYLFLGLASLAQLSADRFPMPDQVFDEGLRVEALLGVFVGCVAFDVGRWQALRLRRHRVSERLERRIIDARRVWFLGVAAVVCTFGVLSTAGGLGPRFTSRQAAEEAIFGVPEWGVQIYQLDNKSVGLVKTMMIWLPVFLAMVLLLYLRRCASTRFGHRRVRWVGTPAATLLLGALILTNLVANNPIANPRIRFGGVAFVVAAILVHLERPRRLRAALCVLLMLLLFVFPYADVFRYNVEQTIRVDTLRDQLIDSPDYAMFQQEMNGIVYVRANGHTLGRQTLGAALPFVPKSVWADQPDATGDLISRSDQINASSTLWTEANVEAGLPAIVLLFLLYGVGALLADEAYERRDRRRPSIVGVAVPLFASFQFFILRGSLLPVVGDLGPIVVIVLLCSRQVRRPAEASAAEAEGAATAIDAEGEPGAQSAGARSTVANARP